MDSILNHHFMMQPLNLSVVMDTVTFFTYKILGNMSLITGRTWAKSNIIFPTPSIDAMMIHISADSRPLR